MITPVSAWELGFEDADIGIDTSGPMYWVDKENKQDLSAMNTYVVGLPPKADSLFATRRISASKKKRFNELFDDWKKFYEVTWKSWYVSDSDVSVAKKKVYDINMVLIPEATEWAQSHSSQAKGMSKAEQEEKAGESKSWMERHWMALTGVALVLGTSAYLASSFFAYRKLALVRGIVHH